MRRVLRVFRALRFVSKRTGNDCCGPLRDVDARLLRTLHHPNIVRYHQFFQSADAMYIVMSRCLGPDLMDHMEAGV